MNMINGKMCLFDENTGTVICRSYDLINIVDRLLDDGYYVVNLFTFKKGPINVFLGADFDCIITLDSEEDKLIREIDGERILNIRNAPIF